MKTFLITLAPLVAAEFGAAGQTCSHITCEHLVHNGNCGGGRANSLDNSATYFQGEPCVAHGQSSIRVHYNCAETSAGPKAWGGRACAETVCADGHFCGMNNNKCECVALTTTAPAKFSALTCTELGWARKHGPAHTAAGNDVCGASRCRSVLAVQGGGGDIDYGTADLAEANTECTKFGARLCTQTELLVKESTGTGCSHDTMWIWSSTSCGNGKTYVVFGNPDSKSTKSKCKDNDDDSHHVRCCADDVAPTYKSQASCKQLGWSDILGSPAVCGASQCRGTLGVQDGGGALEYGEADQAHAEMVCINNGSRLCTATELENKEAAGTGCSHDDKGIWSSTTCDNKHNKHWVVTQGSTGTSSKTCKADSDDAHHIRCCADAVIPGSASSKTCAMLGWAVGSTSAVCGASRCRNTLAQQDGGGTLDYGVATHAEASGQCTAYGARLCTKGEIQADETTGTGCSQDGMKIWTSSPCDSRPNMHWVLDGNGNSAATCAADSDDSHHIRCCADA